MIHLYQELKTTFKVFGLLLFSVATSFCSYAQENSVDNLEDIDGLIDELFFDDQQFLDELLETSLSYNFLYTSVSYNSNTFFSGRDSGTDQFNIIPQVSYYHSSGFNASISGIYYQEFAPAWDFTSLSLGYFNTFGKNNTFVYNIGYTKFFYTDDFDDFTNSIDINFGVRNKKRTLGTTIAASYLFGSDESYQIVSNSFANITLKRTSDFAIRFRPSINFIIADQTITFKTFARTVGGLKIITTTQNVFDLLNTQFSIPLSISTHSWDFELGYNLNIPRALSNETNINNTGFFNLSLGYMFDFNRK
ncbi:hypothetical protein [Polaribacter sp. R77954]|uniref:hypothetical protein n=1 Tax=Polaribacter sp. R77954 TaxID=3093870 RepID=UPI0037C546F9